jgi:tripartite-type tricarboxylate transporter receptor subunit TctC
MISKVAGLMFIVVFFVSSVLAADFPTKAITLICPVAPGGSLDLNARAFATIAEKHLGKPVVVLNKPGASGAVGTMAVIDGKPDGHTICLAYPTQTAITIAEIVNGRKPPFTINDFAILGRMINSPAILNVRSGSPWKTAQQVISDVKSHPPYTYKWAGSGIYSIGHLPLEVANKELNVKFKLVPTKGGGEIISLLLGGHVDICILYPGNLFPYVQSKQMRALASFGEKRIKGYEDIPTFKELGYPNLTFYAWYGLIAHKDTPAPILEKLRNLVKAVSDDPAFVNIIEKGGDIVEYADAEKAKENWQKEYTQLYPLVEALEKEKK